jgi:hypothetical protein
MKTSSTLLVWTLLALGCAHDGAAPGPNEQNAHAQQTQNTPAQPGEVDCGRIVEGLNEVAPNRESASRCLTEALAECRPARLFTQHTSDEGHRTTQTYVVIASGASCELEVTSDTTNDPLAADPGIHTSRCRTATMQATEAGPSILTTLDCE